MKINIQQENLKTTLDRVIKGRNFVNGDYSTIDKQIDTLLGLDIEKTETELENEEGPRPKESYIGANLKSEGLLTSYLDFYSIYKFLPETKGKTFVDLGAGYGRSALLFSQLSSELKTLAIEYIQKRIEVGQKIKLKKKLNNAEFLHQNLLKDPFPVGDYYFIYLPKNEVFQHSLKKLKELSTTKKIELFVIESHGDIINCLKNDFPWLNYKCIISKTFSKRHNNFIHHFESYPPKKMTAFIKRERELFQNFNKYLEIHNEISLLKIPLKWKHSYLLNLRDEKDLQILIKDQDIGSQDSYLWLASIYQISTSLLKNHYSLKFPDRDIEDGQIIKILGPNKKLQFWINLRNQNKSYKEFGFIRKIIIEPEIKIEFTKKGRILLKDLL